MSGTALVILDKPNHIFQTIYHDNIKPFESVSLDEKTGKIAACSDGRAFIYKPYGYDEGLLKVSRPVKLDLDEAMPNQCVSVVATTDDRGGN